MAENCHAQLLATVSTSLIASIRDDSRINPLESLERIAQRRVFGEALSNHI